MIHQVSVMIIQLFRGYYLLDSKSTQKKIDDEEVSVSLFAQSQHEKIWKLVGDIFYNFRGATLTREIEKNTKL
jgi:hypothetical protein